MGISLRHSIVLEDLNNIVSTKLDWAKFSGKNILITGASGFLPAYMVETLLYLNETRNLGCKVFGVVRDLTKAQVRFSYYAGRSDLILIKGDVSTPVAIDERCDFVIHAASQASPKFYGSDPVGTMTANILGTHQFLEYARKWSSKFLFFSSGEVYGQVEADKIPTAEADYGYIDILNPRSCYAESKRAGETLTVSYYKQFGLRSNIVRPFHTYGPGMSLDDGRVFADFVRDIVNHKNINLKSDGTAVRAFCYLADAVSGFFTVLLSCRYGNAFNVGNPGGAISIGSLADMLVGLFPDDCLSVTRTIDIGSGYVASPITKNIPNISAIELLGWKPKFGVEAGFLRTVNFFKTQYNNHMYEMDNSSGFDEWN